MAVHLLIARRRNGTNCISLVAVTVLLFALSLTQVVLKFSVVLIFSFAEGAILDNGLQDFHSVITSTQNLNNVVAVIGVFLIVTQNFMADCLLTWRCYIIWGRRRLIIAFPALLIVAGTVAGYVLVGYYVKGYLLIRTAGASPSSPSPVLMEEFLVISDIQNDLNEVFYATTFACNVLMTTLIACRILWVSKHLKQASNTVDSNLYRNIVALLTESGGIHSLLLLLSTVTGFSSSPGLAEANILVSTLATITAGMSPTLIIVMLALGKTAEQTTMDKTTIAFAAPSAPARSHAFSVSFQHTENADEQMDLPHFHLTQGPTVPEKDRTPAGKMSYGVDV